MKRNTPTTTLDFDMVNIGANLDRSTQSVSRYTSGNYRKPDGYFYTGSGQLAVLEKFDGIDLEYNSDAFQKVQWAQSNGIKTIATCSA